ncbi:MAG: hypothetical protein JWO19_1974 [Bryobacterales bacterium]|jgi:hypothetical protein|nr:hypothetical protein [Bryobacterales bacterium]
MSIRTTVTLDKDVYDRTRDFSKARGIPFREALNELVRQGLLAESAPRPKTPFKIKPVRMGLRPGLSYDNIEALLEYGEGPLHR